MYIVEKEGKIMSRFKIKLLTISISLVSILSVFTEFVSFEFYISNIIFTFLFLYSGKFFKKSVSFIIYISIALFIYSNIKYFNYFNKYIYWAVFNQIKFFADVSEATLKAFEFKDLLIGMSLIILGGTYVYIPSKVIHTKRRGKKIISFVLIFLILLSHNIYGNIFRGISLNSVFGMSKDTINVDRTIEKNQYTGIAKGKNLLIIQLESFQEFLIGFTYNGQEVTPNLNAFMEESDLYVSRYYQQVGMGNTSDAEFITNNSIYPVEYNNVYSAFPENQYRSLPILLKEKGYTTLAMHGNKREFWNRSKAYKNQGIDHFYAKDDYYSSETLGMGIKDEDFLLESVKYLEETPQPFYGLMITLTQHYPYLLDDDTQELKILKKHEESEVARYLQLAHYVDQAFGKFIESLKREGLYKDTVIAIYGDHHGLYSKNESNHKIMSELLGYDYDYAEMMKVPLIIQIPEVELSIRKNSIYGQIDFMPTMVNLFGLDKSRTFMMGKDILTERREHLPVVSYLPRGSFITERYTYIMSRDQKQLEGNLKINGANESQRYLKKYDEIGKKALRELDYAEYILREDIIYKLINK